MRRNWKTETCFSICVNKHGRTSAFETAFHDYNYQHLTGLETTQTLSAQLFYQACLNRRLSVNDFEFHPNGTSEMKLAVLPLLVNKHLGPLASSEFITGKTHCCLLIVWQDQ